jgi:HK97 gp10 family phage protein
MAGIKLSGFKEFKGKIRKLPKEVKREVGGETFAAAKNWERLSKQLAPVDQGRLRAAIRGSQTGELASQVTCNIEYAAYQEWGTKTRVRVPAELSAYAATFRGGGPGGPGARLMIYAWMQRVGIPQEFQWVTFISIIVKGVKPHPFFFPPAPIVEKEFIKNVRNVINTQH